MSRGERWRDRAVELAAIAGFSDPRLFSIRRLERAARVKRRDAWDRLAFLRLDLRRLLTKSAKYLEYYDLNPTLSEKERAASRAEATAAKIANAPTIGGRELFEILNGK